MNITQNQLDAIVASVLAVNKYGIEKAYAILPALRKAGLLDCESVAKEPIRKVMIRLAETGYDRGLLTEMMAGRLVDLMKAVSARQLDPLPALIARGDRVNATELLCSIKGIGPSVARDVWMLLQQDL
ncbi:MAG: hypothetical protein HY014_02055 [Acidobacteria bacterium]|nr:hypothetical protein [Acidobacteriota bacterium]MBI3486931.1 hypothetical protein [Acidobacteriota bacterium]